MSDIDTQRQIRELQAQVGRTKTSTEILPRDQSVRVANSANISINNGAFTALTFDTERWDPGGLHAANSSQIVIVNAGKYQISANVAFASNGTGYRIVRLMLNGSTQIALATQTPLSADITAMAISTLYNLAASDAITVEVWQNSGAPLNINTVANYSPELMAQLVGN